MRAALISLFLISILHLDAVAAGAAGGGGESIKVDVVGVLTSGVDAIGGESTGTTITSKGVTWELALGELQERAVGMDGQTVRVRGELERRVGVEIKERWIVRVSDLVAQAEADLEVKDKRDGSEVTFSTSAGSPVIGIRCERGIGTATIARKGDQWPEGVSVRLHLNGLESFKVQSGKLELEWSVSSDKQKLTRVALRQGGKESAVEEGSPLHTEVRTMGNVYHVTLPDGLFEGNPREITLRWIDFYR